MDSLDTPLLLADAYSPDLHLSHPTGRDESPPSMIPQSTTATLMLSGDIDQICRQDEAMIRKAMANLSSHGKLSMVLVLHLDHRRWHHLKEEFACKQLLGKQP